MQSGTVVIPVQSILFYVQHLMGVGHVFRARRVVAALVRRGFDVHLVYGGARIPHFDGEGATVHYLPPLRAGSTVFGKLETPEGMAVDDSYKLKRRDMLLALLDRIAPDMIVTEAFPFGRRQMHFELLPMLEAATARANPPVIVSSVRDILQENRKPVRDQETADMVERYFSHVLVHGDPELIRLQDTFPYYNRIAEKVLYTGIVAPHNNDGTTDPVGGPCDVIVSVGGGVMGSQLLLAAAAAKPLSILKDARWRIVTGINVAPEVTERLAAIAGGNVEIHDFLPDLRTQMAHARLSISRAGYNTAADIFRSGTRAIVVPLSDGEETEQLRRAEILEARGLATVLWPREETAEGLAAAIDRAMAGPAPRFDAINLDGAETTASAVSAILAGSSLDDYR